MAYRRNIKDHAAPNIAVPSRMVKILELAFLRKIMPLSLLPLRLVSAPPSPHTQRHYGWYRLRGEAMDWKQLLAYITGTVDQELLLRNEYLVTENRILRQQIRHWFS